MSKEKDIKKVIKRLDKNLLEFIDRAKYLEGRLKEGESLLDGIDELKLGNHIPDTARVIYLEIHRTKGRSERVATINCLGEMTYRIDIFKNYRFLPESQRA